MDRCDYHNGRRPTTLPGIPVTPQGHITLLKGPVPIATPSTGGPDACPQLSRRVHMRYGEKLYFSDLLRIIPFIAASGAYLEKVSDYLFRGSLACDIVVWNFP